MNRHPRFRRWPWAIALALLAATQAAGQETWTREQYTSENGLLQNRVHAIDRDQWGSLLIGTEGGLVRFDGQGFRQIGIPSPEGMRPSRVLEIIAVPDNAFVIRDAGSRQYLYKDHLLTPLTADAPARKPLARFGGRGVSVGTVLRAMDPDSVIDAKASWPYSVRMIPLEGDRWCMRTGTELLVYAESKLVDRFAIPKGKWSHLFKLNGRLIVFDAEGHPFEVDWQTRQSRLLQATGFPPAEIKDGQLAWRVQWEGNAHLVSLVAGDALYDLRLSADGKGLMAERFNLDLPTDCKIGAMVWTIEGQVLAVGTDTKGLYLYRRNSMKPLLCDLPGDGVNNAYFAQAPFGRDGVITSTRGLPRTFTQAGCEEKGPIKRGFDDAAILLDGEQRYWYGRGDSLFTFDLATNEERLVQAGVRPLCFWEDGAAMIIGASKGIYRWEHGHLAMTNPMNDKDLSQRPTALCITPKGELWVATCSGVYHALATGGWKPVPGLAGVCARTLALVGPDIFVGTYGSGAFLFRNDHLFRLPMDLDGFLSHVHAFMPDSAGFLWMSTNQGLFRVRNKDLAQWSNDTTQSLYYAYYGRRTGIRNSEFNGGCSPSYLRTASGWASFPSMDGLVWFRPDEVPDAYPAEPILLEDLTVDGKRMDLPGLHLLDWNHREVVASFSMAYWGTRENARLEYAIEGVQGGKWTLMRPDQQELHLASLPTGATTLRIRKLGAAFRGEGNALEIRFFTPVPFFRTSWFIALCVAVGALMLWALLRLNAARLRRKNLQLEKMVRLRTGELTEANNVLRRSLEMKEMLVSIISHDIVTPLRFIARVANGAAHGRKMQEPGRLHDTLEDLARSSEKLHANAQDLLQWIKRQDGRIELRTKTLALHPFVAEVLGMERERATDKGLQLRNEVPLDDVIATDRNVLSIVLHNLVANAVSHTSKGYVVIRGKTVGNSYTIEVADSGNGMPEAALKHVMRIQGKGATGAMNEEGERDVQGLGLLIVADLLQLLQGSFSVATQPGAGTTFTILLPAAPLTQPVTRATTDPLPAAIGRA
ncbi:MAG TPA: HAMP domain-containing sensor histidine kinase [Flavobacteriales bacterium]|nr:HAMP domain-containing sensor histidine kinase [Flavobacteriales bacterium]